MSKIKVVLDRTQVREQLLQGAGTVEFIKAQADLIAQSLPGNYTTDTCIGATRANASVASADYDTYRDNIKNNTLLKKIGELES